LAGFGHGAAGISWGLAKLYKILNNPMHKNFLKASLAYENSLFYKDAGNWADLRNLASARQIDTINGIHFMKAWCHGAPGIGLSRLEILDVLDEEVVEQDIRVAIQTTLREGFGLSHSLCHGDMGNLDFLFTAAQYFSNDQLKNKCYKLASSINETIVERDIICGNAFGIEIPGLMNGIAGIGYQFLRLNDPDNIPSILLLQ
jgi:lantibiotic modifying enzyme